MTATLAAPPQLLPLRPYQREGIAAVSAAWARGITRPGVELPTGTGKTVMFAHLAKEWHAGPEWAGRVVILVHRDELVQQAVSKLHDIAPHLSVGIVKAERNETGAHVIVASVQTLARPQRIGQLRQVGLVIVDECHHATADSYRYVLDSLGAFDGRCLALGVTATMNRADGQALGDVWQEVVYRRDIIWAMRRGYLCDARGIGITVADFDMSKVRSIAGEFSDHDLGEALENSSALELIAKAYNEHAPGRPGLTFLPTVATSELAAEAFCAAGIPTVHVDGETPTEHRRAILRDYTAGRIQNLTNVGVFVEGTDLPRAEVCLICRPTRSEGLYRQIVGRVLRPYKGKRRALVIDVAGNAARHSLVGFPDLTGADVRPDETILEAVEREELEAAERELAPDLAGLDTAGGGNMPVLIEVETVVERELDLFHGSRQTWQQTDDGWWFMAGRDRFVAVLPDEEPGTWYAGYFLTGRRTGGDFIERDLADQGYAQAWAERWLADNPGTGAELIDKQAKWRRRKTTDAQRNKALRLGCDPLTVNEADTQGQISDLIDQRTATLRIDYRVRNWLWSRPEVASAVAR